MTINELLSQLERERDMAHKACMQCLYKAGKYALSDGILSANAYTLSGYFREKENNLNITINTIKERVGG